MRQVGKDHYDFARYCYPERWASYYHQLKETIELSPREILEIGVGDGVFRGYIRYNTSIAYSSLDIAEDLNPDVVGSVEHIPLPENSFDCMCAFEILEHLPFEKFNISLEEIRRVTRRFAVISLPHFGPAVKLNIKIPFLPEIKVACKIPFPKEHTFNGQHYWEIGKRGFPLKKILAAIEKHFIVRKHFVPFESQYHRFFVLEKNNRSLL